MDIRETLSVEENFEAIIKDLQKSNMKASIIYDQNGMTRAEGIIASVNLIEKIPYFRYESGQKIALNSLIAVNGMFLPAYSEC